MSLRITNLRITVTVLLQLYKLLHNHCCVNYLVHLFVCKNKIDYKMYLLLFVCLKVYLIFIFV